MSKELGPRCSQFDKNCTSAQRLLFATRRNLPPSMPPDQLRPLALQDGLVRHTMTFGGCEIRPVSNSSVRPCTGKKMFIAFCCKLLLDLVMHFLANLVNLSCSIFITFFGRSGTRISLKSADRCMDPRQVKKKCASYLYKIVCKLVNQQGYPTNLNFVIDMPLGPMTCIAL